MNEYDSERIAAVLEENGFLPAAGDDADVVILNTCSVREKPQHKVDSAIGRLRLSKERTGKPQLIGIMGCVAQQEGRTILEHFPCVDFVLGTDAAATLGEVLTSVSKGERIADTAFSEDGFSLLPFERQKSLQAYVSIMKGCNNFCSYCIVPYVRGREKSRGTEEVKSEIRRLIDSGTKEITLLGQNVNSYGTGLSDGKDFPTLLAEIAKIPGLLRLRFVTSHPKDFSDELVAIMAKHKNICPYIHLPLQSGSDAVLNRMKRGYTASAYFEKIEAARKIIPNLAFSSDFILGFPGETDEDFEKTCEALKRVRYESIFAFNYSVRPGTKAAELKDDVPKSVKTARLERLIALQEEISSAHYNVLIGQKLSVLVEGISKRDALVYTGRTLTGRIMNFTAALPPETGREVEVILTEAKRNTLFGKLA